MSLPKKIYIVWFDDFENKNYYSKKNRRFYTQPNHVMQYLKANRNSESFNVFLIEQGEAAWQDVTQEFRYKLQKAISNG